ncbi:unnamed protein product [Oppiella nova]|uniref:GT23 domain-containing protein n=1 Tax=Oppiella nova TaxID=334625 RepID=A0A7R9M8B6_9ACAR|nr:unnamed protein product [Oppiella nova]CAG2172513.1 unnamed protein product [Oppiella nova]
MEVQNVSQTMGLTDYKNERLKQISKQIYSKVDKLQNPPKNLCDSVSKLICKLSVDAGFASGIHEILWCLLSAYYNNQTVILIPDWTKYFGRTPDVWERMFLSLFTTRSRENWNDIFQPLSTSCDYKDLPKDQLNAPERPNTVIDRKLMNELPKQFGSELMDILDGPNSWFHSQFVGYILRPQPRLEEFIKNFKKQINYRHPIVGIQVRRTDKISYGEALYYPISDYMVSVEDYFDKLELTQQVPQRLVYVASDDPSVLPQLIKQYPNYEFIGSTSNAKIAFSQTTRYSNESLWGILADVFLLSESDYIVCTFSSAICRLSYQLMRYKQLDASLQYRSLDVPFHYHHSLTPIRAVVYNHRPKSEEQWNLRIGDRLHERIRGRFTEWFDQSINGRVYDDIELV